MRLDIATPADHPAIAALILEAFGPDGGPAVARMVEDLRVSDVARPEFELVARAEDGGVLGHVMLSGTPFTADAAPESSAQDVPDGGPAHVLMLSPLAVTAPARRHGIGARLVESALGRAEQAGELLVALAGDPAYYGRFGFRAGAELGIRVPVPDWAPPESGQVRRLAAHERRAAPLRGAVTWPDVVPEG